MSTTFLDILQDGHMRNYTWNDDDAPDAFASWLEDLDDEDIVDYFQYYIDRYPSKVVAKELYNLIN